MPFDPFFSRVRIAGLQDLPTGTAFSHVVSLLNPGFETESLAQLKVDRHLVVRFHDEIDPRDGHVLPTSDDMVRILAFLDEIDFDSPRTSVLIHCHSGISRSTAVAALAAANADPDRDPVAIMRSILHMRPIAWPNSLILKLGEDALGLSGKLSGAVLDLFRARITAENGLGERMIRLRRKGDLVAAGLVAA